MLNKEQLLMAGEGAPQAHILMTVGKGKRVGWYPSQDVGSVNKVPSWHIDGYTCVLSYLTVEDEGWYTIGGLSSNYQDNFTSLFVIKISVDGISKDFTFRNAYSSSDAVMGDPFELQSKVGQTLDVTFDPPPDGYAPPRT